MNKLSVNEIQQSFNNMRNELKARKFNDSVTEEEFNSQMESIDRNEELFINMI